MYNKERENVSVRVDFMANGDIIPISYTDKSGTAHRIKFIEKVDLIFMRKGETEVRFICDTASEKISLVFVDNFWYKVLM